MFPSIQTWEIIMKTNPIPGVMDTLKEANFD